MAKHWAVYKYATQVPDICCLQMGPDGLFGDQIGGFPVCGSKTTELIELLTEPDSVETVFTGLCAIHAVDLLVTVPRWFIQRFEKYNPAPPWIAP